MEHRRALVEYAARIVGSRAQAEDLVQEAWFRLDAAVRKRAIHEPLAYLYRIVRNLALDGRSTALREGQVVVSSDFSEIARSSQFSGPTPEGIALYKDELRQLLRAWMCCPSGRGSLSRCIDWEDTSSERSLVI